MDPEAVINLFDFFWFALGIFDKQNSGKSPDQKMQENKQENKQGARTSSLPILVRSKSDLLSSMASFNPDSLSPDSVLFTANIQTVWSGKGDVEELEGEEEAKQPSVPRKRRSKKGFTKSLSDLEFEEVKGFMDLGFVFSEEDANSSLVEIIPGLQRLGKKDGEKEEPADDGNVLDESSSVPRPYLSEAWEVLERRKRETPLMNWRIPALSNETDVKNSLKRWAHTVASTIR
ncbi:uncharacterized protein LOC127808648 [Diospyros lotus]|uniref:uncharacterized protein LOC127808648 n=1 Tax=Diospyros lotus TaxID=55363 RepID=UPI002253675F|nr:uncharacterized protein LOC127808648 [Diospyros lotus]